jgi:hypothetical protein
MGSNKQHKMKKKGIIKPNLFENKLKHSLKVKQNFFP